jgi:hypothetical protein
MATERFDTRCRATGSEAYFFHGLAVQTAEATANAFIATSAAAGIAPGRGNATRGAIAIPDPTTTKSL